MKKKSGGMKITKGDSRSKETKQKQSLKTTPFPGDCGAGSGKGKHAADTHQWGSGVKGKCF